MIFYFINIIKLLFYFLLPLYSPGLHSNELSITTPAKQVIIYDHQLKQILYKKNSDQLMKPASMAKLMTAYIVFDRLQEGSLRMTDKFLISENAWKKGGSRTFLELNSQVTVKDLIRGLIVQSGNDAAIALAEGISGTEDDFSREMNQYGKMLEMEKTFFTNSTGWPHPDLRTTANDLLKLSNAMIENFPELYKLFLEKEFTYNKIKQYNRNPLLIGRFTVNGADGLKTGHTNESGYGLVGSVVRNDRRISIVINGLGGKKQRAIECKRLFEIVFRETYLLQLFKNKKTLASANVWLGKKNKIDLVSEKPVKVLIERPLLRKVKVILKWEGPIKAPIKKNQKVGLISIQIPGKKNIEVGLVSSSKVNELGPFSKLKSAFDFLLFGENID